MIYCNFLCDFLMSSKRLPLLLVCWISAKIWVVLSSLCFEGIIFRSTWCTLIGAVYLFVISQGSAKIERVLGFILNTWVSAWEPCGLEGFLLLTCKPMLFATSARLSKACFPVWFLFRAGGPTERFVCLLSFEYFVLGISLDSW